MSFLAATTTTPADSDYLATLQPNTICDWLEGDTRSIGSAASHTQQSFKRTCANKPWQWPDRPIVFIADPHADAWAFEQSLWASGAVAEMSPTSITLNAFGQSARFIIGGDCLDKGPSNLGQL